MQGNKKRIDALEREMNAVNAELTALKITVMSVILLMRLSRNDLESARLIVFDQVADLTDGEEQQIACALSHMLFDPAVQVAQAAPVQNRRRHPC